MLTAPMCGGDVIQHGIFKRFGPLWHFGERCRCGTGCYSFDLAAWRLRHHIKHDKGDLWTRAANYHSKTPHYKAIYRADLIAKTAKWADWLDARFVTYDETKPGVPELKPAVTVAKESVAAAPIQQPVKTVSWNTSKYVPRKLIINGQP